MLRTQLFDTHGQGIEITDFAPRFYSRARMFRPLTLVRRVRPLQRRAAHPRLAATARSDWGRARPADHPGQQPHPLCRRLR